MFGAALVQGPVTLAPIRKVLRALRSSPLVARTRRVLGRPFLVNLRALLERIPFKPLELNCVYLLDYQGRPPQHAPLLRGPATVRAATLTDLEGLTGCQQRRREFLHRFQANDSCAVAVVDHRIVAFQWYCVKPRYEEERYQYRLEVPADSIYEYDVFILPEFRLGGIWFKFHCLYLAELMDRLGRTRLIGMIDYGNRLSMNTHLRFGFQIFRRVVIIRIFGKSFFFERSLRYPKGAGPRWLSRSRSGNGRKRGQEASRRPAALAGN
jgi:hypothetical protein